MTKRTPEQHAETAKLLDEYLEDRQPNLTEAERKALINGLLDAFSTGPPVEPPPPAPMGGQSGNQAGEQNQEKVLFFSAPQGCRWLVFAPPERALYVDQLHRAIEESKTWGEFRGRLPPEEYANLFEDCFSDDFREPGDDKKFSFEDVPGVSDGDYPPWVATEQHLYLPQEVLRQFARQESSVINGSFWFIALEQREAILERLRELGYTVEEREDLKFW